MADKLANCQMWLENAVTSLEAASRQLEAARRRRECSREQAVEWAIKFAGWREEIAETAGEVRGGEA